MLISAEKDIMTARIIKGSEIAAGIRNELKDRVTRLKEKGRTPFLCVVLVGDDPGSISYVTSKEKGSAEVGVKEKTFRLPASTTELEVLKLVGDLNEDPDVDGILVQSPLPRQIDAEKILFCISPAKDVDGWHPVNLGKLMRGDPCLLPCTPHGIQQILVRSGYDPSGKHVVILGRSNIVGRPLANLLMQFYTRQADILVAAMGSPLFVKADMVKDGAVVIDVGSNRIEDKAVEKGWRWAGDVDFEKVKEKAAAITPVPGGVGPMTVTMLLQNTIEAAELKAGLLK